MGRSLFSEFCKLEVTWQCEFIKWEAASAWSCACTVQIDLSISIKDSFYDTRITERYFKAMLADGQSLATGW